MKYRFYPLHAGEDISSCDELYDSKAEIRARLISYHSVDWNEEEGKIETKSLDYMLEYGQWGLTEIIFENCPLCGDGQVEYKPWLSTDVYVCDTCPFVGFKYFEQQQLTDLTDYLNHNSK